MTRVDLPSGAWAELRDPSLIRKKDRDRVLIAIDDVDGSMARSIRSADMVLALAIESWSYDAPLPCDALSSLGDMPIPDYDELCTAAKPIEEALFPDFKMKVADGALLEGSPT